jgi:hypothetical protein
MRKGRVSIECKHGKQKEARGRKISLMIISICTVIWKRFLTEH